MFTEVLDRERFAISETMLRSLELYAIEFVVYYF